MYVHPHTQVRGEEVDQANTATFQQGIWVKNLQ